MTENPLPPPSFFEKLKFGFFHQFYLLFFFFLDLTFLLRCPRLLPSMLRLWNWSLGQNPHHAFLSLPKEQRDLLGDALVYGEIALPTIEKLLRLASLSSNDTLLDLGSGRGRVVLLAAAQGIPAQGFEIVEPLLRCSRYASRDLLPLASFSQADIQTSDLSHATAFWLSGTCFSSPLRHSLAARIAQALPGTKIISVTSPLTHPRLPVLHRVWGWASWGRDLFYVQEVADLPPSHPPLLEDQPPPSPEPLPSSQDKPLLPLPEKTP